MVGIQQIIIATFLGMFWKICSLIVNIVPYDCESSPADCFLHPQDMYGLYKNPNCHLDIRSAGITHLMHNPELFIEGITRWREDTTFIFEW